MSSPQTTTPDLLDIGMVNDTRRMKSALRIPRQEIAQPEEVLTNSTMMLLAIGATGRHLYEGTVPRAEIDRRRAKNRRARRARRVHRG